MFWFRPFLSCILGPLSFPKCRECVCLSYFSSVLYSSSIFLLPLNLKSTDGYFLLFSGGSFILKPVFLSPTFLVCILLKWLRTRREKCGSTFFSRVRGFQEASSLGSEFHSWMHKFLVYFSWRHATNKLLSASSLSFILFFQGIPLYFLPTFLLDWESFYYAWNLDVRSSHESSSSPGSCSSWPFPFFLSFFLFILDLDFLWSSFFTRLFESTSHAMDVISFLFIFSFCFMQCTHLTWASAPSTPTKTRDKVQGDRDRNKNKDKNQWILCFNWQPFLIICYWHLVPPSSSTSIALLFLARIFFLTPADTWSELNDLLITWSREILISFIPCLYAGFL